MKSRSSSIVIQGRLTARSPFLALLVALLVALSTTGLARAAEVRAGGHPIPAKGPLVSELREEVESDKPGHITIIRKYEDAQGNQVREFSSQGAVYQIQVVPANGPTYYLIDTDGDGLFESRSNGYEPLTVVPQWVLFRY
ncbi:hypothetical protein SIID45300_00864 [Candidatus Magnetaquicoccaceae bacterium FCR-1]|uniref:DUF2782 domain-containing protein n=1 Tax=Candidatus Magnetaquiglobus chichijimensis TaxID=3141448 RepID=A0ABQ0C6P8_9PROT